ncbi:PNOC protein, partial [Nycticryphes semicollaris]|nr:PNOC protein [Nycticryphes semicollaris]
MRAVLWDLLLLCLFARARGDCRGDCLHCDRHLYRDSFDVLVCILECEGEAVPRATWELCAAASRPAPRPRDLPDTGDPWHEGVVAVPAVPVNPLQVSQLLRRREAEDEGVEAAPGAFPQPPEDISRRLGGFPRGTRGSWPAPTARGVQKRYGGFIGVRKSARKWNNQKRFSEFLKQYLGMSPRSSEYDIPGGVSEHNEI